MKRILSVIFFLVSLQPAHAVIAPKIIKSNSGITAWYAYDKKTTVIAINFLFKGGARLDPDDKLGLALFSAGILSTGTQSKDPEQFDSFLQDHAIQIGFSADHDALSGSLITLTQHKEKAFALLKEVLTTPRLKDDTFQNIMNMSKTSLANATHDPGYIAGQQMSQTIFKGHAYERPIEGTIKGIEKITLKDIDQYIKSSLTQENVMVAITGNLTEDEAKKFLDDIFGALPVKGKAVERKTFKPLIDGSTKIIEMQIPQSHIYFVLPTIEYDDPDFFKQAVLMHIMGEDQSSRLFKEIRVKSSLAYAVQASTAWRQDAGYVFGYIGSTKDKANKSIDLLKSEWQRLKKSGITAEELEDAKESMLNAFPLRFSNSDSISKMLLSFQFVNRPINYFQLREKIISELTLDQMNSYIKRVVEPEKLTLIIVGKPDEKSPVKAPEVSPEKK